MLQYLLHLLHQLMLFEYQQLLKGRVLHQLSLIPKDQGILYLVLHSGLLNFLLPQSLQDLLDLLDLKIVITVLSFQVVQVVLVQIKEVHQQAHQEVPLEILLEDHQAKQLRFEK